MRYLALGDSYTIGTGASDESHSWPSIIARRLNAELTNPSVNGYTTLDLIRDELPYLERIKPDLVSILIGVNDLVQGRPPDLNLRRDIVRQIRKYKPELVITHIPGRVLDAPMGGSHPDHLAVGEATMAAVYPDSRNPRAFRSLLKQGFKPHEVKEVWIPFWTLGDYLVDITPTLDRKIEALRKHKSQVSKPGREWDFEKFMRRRHRDVGKRGGYQYAESFKRITV